MAKTRSFQPDWTSAPGETIADILDERDLSVSEFAERLDESVSKIEDLLEGRASLTIQLARELEDVLGGSTQFWMARDYKYREDVARLRAEEQSWLEKLPIADMVNFGWLPREPHPIEELEVCLQFFDVSSVEAWREKYLNTPQLAALRTSPSFDTEPAALATWLHQGYIQGQAIETDPWKPDTFHDILLDVRPLTREKDPDKFLPQLQARCASAGVAVLALPAPTGCRASGATRFIDENKALLLLSFRHLTDDHFWFSFFHEAAHLILHGQDALFVEGIDEVISDGQEKEADNFAEDLLIPPEHREEMLNLPVDAKAVIRFARKVSVSPGIVVGQLQHHGVLDYGQLNSLKRRYEWTDGQISLENA